MSWKDHKESVYSVRKVNYDGLWHVLYGKQSHRYMSEIYDRISQRTAMYIVKMMPRWRSKYLNKK